MEVVTLKELADTFGLDRSSARKWLVRASERLGLSPVTVRPADGRGQQALAWPKEDAARLVEQRKAEGHAIGEARATPVAEANSRGVFYLLQAFPDAYAKRVKVGFADNLESRLASHRSTLPTLEVVKTWPCRRVWEPAALACVAAVGTRVGNSSEVFDVEDIDALATRLDAFFAHFPAS